VKKSLDQPFAFQSFSLLLVLMVSQEHQPLMYCTISSYTGFATRDDVMPMQLPRMTQYSIELLRYRRLCPICLLDEWSRYATCFEFQAVEERDTWQHTFSDIDCLAT